MASSIPIRCSKPVCTCTPNWLRDADAAHRVLVAVARYLAAHAPTSRAMLQTAKTARRLHRGEDLTIDPDEEGGPERANGRTDLAVAPAAV